jgi:hypothetical protein
MPCLNAQPFLEEAVASVLHQPECLELLVADGGSNDGSLQHLAELAKMDPRIRLVSRSDAGPADALNKAAKAARGSLIGWLNADDLYPPGCLARAVRALAANPHWLMLYGEGDEFQSATGESHPYPTKTPDAGLAGFRSHCFICQPTVVMRRSLLQLLGPFDPHWRTAFDYDYWLRAFSSFPARIGYIPTLQGRTRLHANTISTRMLGQAVLESIELFHRHFGPAPATRLELYAQELQQGSADTPEGDNIQEHLTKMMRLAAPFVDSSSLKALTMQWQQQNLLTQPVVESTEVFDSDTETSSKSSSASI